MKKLALAVVVLVLSVAVGLFVAGKPRQQAWTSGWASDQALTFPKDFYFGTATAAQQIESQSPSDWTAFELDVIANKRTEHGSAPGVAKPGHIAALDQFSQAVRTRKTDYDQRYAEDFQAAREVLGNNAYRFSFEWSRLFPRADMTRPDPAAIAFYQGVLDSLKAQGLTPFATLFHFSSPAWLWTEQDGQRGWERADAQQQWQRYVDAVLEHFGGQIQHWTTLNEPMVFLNAGYLDGVFPPLETRADPAATGPALAAMARAHAYAYHAIKQHAQAQATSSGQPVQETWVGITQHTRAFEPWRNWHPLERFAARQIDEIFIWDLLDALESGELTLTGTGFSEQIEGLASTQDYVGINYYGRFYVEVDMANPAKPIIHSHDPATDQWVNDLGWALYPKGFGDVLQTAYERYNKPIYVLENGTADQADNDVRRQYLLVTHLAEMAHAMQQGVPLKGYFHWSLTDNFEWAEGFTARFGLFALDYANDFKRTARPSASLYGRIAREGLQPALLQSLNDLQPPRQP
ncbi:glycoside hydrolase family 1 protein [Atopomonas sediminilitoris]|uniref:glycoside hydrolase family 1 protein n=1 Tax=Atopomonas sediminilitoris TaxID=2919919 RepID=UPI001F4D3881|nr:family 1 glycosylhydrolase [Atopomonas sediminilitoris]MCJ8167856.1 family 1 glycosylhydrolase [Atopomonas sediminilitoris]